MHRYMSSILLTVTLSLCASGANAQSARTPSGSPVPQLDAHLHLFSPAVAALVSDPPREAVTLPQPLEEFLRARVATARDREALGKLYMRDAWLLESFNPGWVRSGDSIAAWWANNTESPYGLVPVGYGVHGANAFITSYLTDKPGGSERQAHVTQSLVRGEDGQWRISSETLTMGGPRTVKEIPVDLVASVLDSAGIRRGLIHSLAYMFGSGDENAAEYAMVQAENDWTADQVARYPTRLRAFCSVNPLRSYALREIDRCAASGRFRGLKLHVGNSRVDLTSAQHVTALRQVFQRANERRLPIAIHLMTYGSPYGRGPATTFLEQVLAAAPDIPVQIAHLGGTGTLDPGVDSALAVLADAITARDPRTRNLWFDVAGVVPSDFSREYGALVARRIRQVGVQRVLHGSDTPDARHLHPREAWAAFRKLPLSPAEFRVIAGNLPPYAR